MNQTIHQNKLLVLNAMRQRLQGHHAAARRSAGLPVERPCRFQVHSAGHNSFDVVDRASGRQINVIDGHLAACRFASQMEKEAELQECQRRGAKHFGFTMALWALLFGAVIASIMLFGV
jgi:hypothetical protein